MSGCDTGTHTTFLSERCKLMILNWATTISIAFYTAFLLAPDHSVFQITQELLVCYWSRHLLPYSRSRYQKTNAYFHLFMRRKAKGHVLQ